MEAVRLFERGTCWDINFRECWHITLLNVISLQESLGIPAKLSDLKGWKSIVNIKYEPVCVVGKTLSSLLKCQCMQSWKVLVTCVGNFWWWKMFLVWRWQSDCSAIVKISSANWSGPSLSPSQETLKKVVENTIMGPLAKFNILGLWNKTPIFRWGK